VHRAFSESKCSPSQDTKFFFPQDILLLLPLLELPPRRTLREYQRSSFGESEGKTTLQLTALCPAAMFGSSKPHLVVLRANNDGDANAA